MGSYTLICAHIFKDKEQIVYQLLSLRIHPVFLHSDTPIVLSNSAVQAIFEGRATSSSLAFLDIDGTFHIRQDHDWAG